MQHPRGLTAARTLRPPPFVVQIRFVYSPACLPRWPDSAGHANGGSRADLTPFVVLRSDGVFQALLDALHAPAQ